MTAGGAEKSCRGKKRHRTEAAAKAFADLQRAIHMNSYHRAYPCDICGGWHLTTKPRTDR